MVEMDVGFDGENKGGVLMRLEGVPMWLGCVCVLG